MIRQTRQMTPKRTDAGLLTSDSEPFAFFGVIWRILFGCGGAALGYQRLKDQKAHMKWVRDSSTSLGMTGRKAKQPDPFESGCC
jgi:hypothetical protein